MRIYEETEYARLQRSSAASATNPEEAVNEWIGEGPLWRMIRAAITDPDGELWRYAINVSGDIICGEKIRTIVQFRSS